MKAYKYHKQHLQHNDSTKAPFRRMVAFGGLAKRRSIRVCLEFTLVDFTLTKEWVLFLKKRK